MELWLGIEDYLQEQAQDRSRIIVFTGPIFSDVDPVYRGVDIPLRFFKVAAFIRQGFVPRPEAVEEVPPLGRSGPSRHPSGTSPNSPAWTWTSW